MSADTELPKTYAPAELETSIYQKWLDEGCFTANPAAKGDPYCIVIPPPNVTGALHLGHALNNTLQDILIRRARMQGKNTLWVPGVDHAGIATQAVVEKQLKEKENKTRHDVGREALVQRIWDWKQQYGDRIISQLQRMGCSCDWSRQRFTLDDMCAKAVRETFFKLFKDGLIYRGKRLVNWDTHLLTSISDDELYTESVKTNLWSIKYPIDGTNQTITIATTRPETMLADTAVAYHSSNPQADFLRGKFIRLPLTNRLVPLIEDDILVDPEFGTGYVKVTPAHDPNDYAVYQRHLGKPTQIEILNMMTPDGKVTDEEPWKAYAGLRLETAARKKILEDLAAAGLHNPDTDTKPHVANVNFSDRSKTAIQPYLSDQWFVKMAPLAEPALDVVRNETVKFFPERHSQQYLSWLGEKRDWPISRQLWWGHRIPVWTKTVEDTLEVFHELDQLVDDSLEEVLSGEAESNSLVVIDAATGEKLQPSVLELNHGLKRSVHLHLCLGPNTDSSKWERNGWVQDPDVLDTWFSSALWPHSTLGWPDQTAELAKYYPGAVLLTGRDIITLWVARMVMTGLYNMGGIPFHHVAINPTILDGHGERMAKSKGNGVDPVEIIEAYGADALRFTLATMATETQDVRMPVKKDDKGRNTSDKFDLGRNFANKLWNAARFVLSQAADPALGTAPSSAALSLPDRWILARFAQAVSDSNAALEKYRFDLYAKACYDFFWRDFCDWYLEAIKPAMKDPARKPATIAVLLEVMSGLLRLLHPIIPFITEAIWEKLTPLLPAHLTASSSRIIKSPWPAPPLPDTNAQEALASFTRLQEIIVALRNARNEHKADAKKPSPVIISAPQSLADEINANRVLIESLATVTISQIGQSLDAPPNSVRISVAGVDLFALELFDPEAEQKRIAKRKDELTKSIAALQNRLASPSYTDKAPPALVAQTQKQLQDAQAELAKL